MTTEVVTASVLIIGNEILSGRTQDTNLQYIAQHMSTKGVTIKEAHVIPDIHAAIISAVNDVRNRFDYVLTTGGIGPTHDDITAECIAKAFGVELVINPTIAERIRRRSAPESVMKNRLLMARIPKGASLIENLTDGPQGFSIDNVYVMAGLPSVLQAMLPTIEFSGGDVVQSRSVTAYLGESEIAGELRDIQARHADVNLGSYPFYREERYGTTLVMCGTDPTELAIIEQEVYEVILSCGGQAERVVENEK